MPVDILSRVSAAAFRVAEASPVVAQLQAVAVAGKEVPPPAAAPPAAVNAAELQAAVSHLNDYVQTLRRDLQFSVDKSTGKFIVRVMDAETGELIRQIPAEEVLQVSASLGHNSKRQTGILLQGEA